MERKIISHRANLNGPDRETENSFESILKAINLGFDVETDIWCERNVLYIGHDYDKKKFFKNTLDFLLEHSDKLWVHCKNIEALIYLLEFKELNVFGHDNDNYVLTSKHNMFCKPGHPPNKNAVIVMPEIIPVYNSNDFNNCYGVCTDYPIEIQKHMFDRFCQIKI